LFYLRWYTYILTSLIQCRYASYILPSCSSSQKTDHFVLAKVNESSSLEKVQNRKQVFFFFSLSPRLPYTWFPPYNTNAESLVQNLRIGFFFISMLSCERKLENPAKRYIPGENYVLRMTYPLFLTG